MVGTGIQWAAQTTLAAERSLRSADKVLYAVSDPWAAQWIEHLNSNAVSLPYPRDGRPRVEIYRTMVACILDALREHPRVCAAFYGSPVLLADAAHASLRAARDQGYRATLLPGVSSVDCLFSDLNIDPTRPGYQVFEADVFMRRPMTPDPTLHLVLCQVALVGLRSTLDERVNGKSLDGVAQLRAKLSFAFGEHHRVFIYESASHPAARSRVEEIALRDLCTAHLGELSTLYVPPTAPPSAGARRTD